MRRMPAASIEEVDPALERHDPAVDEIVGLHALTAEVVGDEDTAGGLQVGGRLVALRDGIEAEVEHLDVELAAGHDDRATAAHPALVGVGGVELAFRHRLVEDVHAGIEEADDLAVRLDAVGQVDRVIERVSERERDRSLAVSGGAVEQQRSRRVGRGAEPGDGAFGKHQVRECARHRFRGDLVGGDRLRGHLCAEGFKSHGRRSGVLALSEGLDCPFAADVGERVAIDRAARLRQAEHLDETLLARLFEHFVDDHPR
jgi:hypothetical protein